MKKEEGPPPLTFPENVTAWEIFQAVRTQPVLAVGMGATLLGLQHSAIDLQMKLRSIDPDDQLDLFTALALLESFYVADWNRRQKKKLPPKRGRRNRE